MKKNFKYMPAIILAVVIAFLVKIIVKNPQQTVNILIPLVGLGVVILVHEFGHFIVARMCKMKTEAFSIGFGHVVIGLRRTEKGYRVRILPDFLPKDDDPEKDGLLSFTFGKCKPGTTEYRLSMIPLGGYVKILGQEDLGSAEKNPDPDAFMNKPVWQRLAVISAGVICNVILAVIIFMVVFSVGLKSPAPVIGGVAPGSNAAQAGFEVGDEVLQIGNETDLTFQDIMMAAALGDPGKEIEMKVETADGQTKDIAVKPEKGQGVSMLSIGVEPASSLLIAKYKDDSDNVKMTEKTGLKPNDKIVAINGKQVEHSWEFYDVLSDVNAASVNLTVQRKVDQNLKTIDTEVGFDYLFSLSYLEPDQFDPNSEKQLGSFYSMVPLLSIPGDKEKIGKKRGPIRRLVEQVTGDKFVVGDVIVGIGDVNYPNYKDLRDQTTLYENKKMPITVLRMAPDGGYEKVTITKTPKRSDPNGPVMLGIPIAAEFDLPRIAGTIDKDNFAALDIPDGAVIKTVAGKKVNSFAEMMSEVYANMESETTITFVSPDGSEGSVSFLPMQKQSEAVAYLDVPLQPLKWTYKAENGMQALSMGFEKTGKFIIQTYMTLKAVIVGNVGADNLMGPIAMIGAGSKLVGEQKDFMRYLWLQGLISACLAVMNFLPIPVVDGGHAVILIIEKIKGSPVNPKIIEGISYVGFVLLMGLFLFVTWNDLVRVILDKF